MVSSQKTKSTTQLMMPRSLGLNPIADITVTAANQEANQSMNSAVIRRGHDAVSGGSGTGAGVGTGEDTRRV